MGNGFTGEIRLFAGNFAPKGWAFCDGRLLPIKQYTALYSILGATYGGDDRSTFALPDLRGSVPIGAGESTFVSKSLGELTKPETIELPDEEAGRTIKAGEQTLALNFVICLEGLYPPRSS